MGQQQSIDKDINLSSCLIICIVLLTVIICTSWVLVDTKVLWSVSVINKEVVSSLVLIVVVSL